MSAEVIRLRDELSRIGEWGPAAAWRTLVDAELTRSGDDPAAWRQVLQQDLLPVHLLAYAQFRLGRAHLNGGDRIKATTALKDAAERAERIGAGLVTGWVHDLARRAGIAELVPPEVSGPANGHGLTPREVEVLRLVASGRSNRQIGEELFISGKTASVHVSNILAKLGVSGRGEAAAVAHDLL